MQSSQSLKSSNRQIVKSSIVKSSNVRSCVQALTPKRLCVNQQIRLGHHVEPDRAHALAHRVGELVMMAEQVQPRPHRRQHFVDHRLAGVDAPPCRIERPRRFVREEDVDAGESPCRPAPPRARSDAACRRGSYPASSSPWSPAGLVTAAASTPASDTSSARTCRRAPRRATARPGEAPPLGR